MPFVVHVHKEVKGFGPIILAPVQLCSITYLFQRYATPHVLCSRGTKWPTLVDSCGNRYLLLQVSVARY